MKGTMLSVLILNNAESTVIDLTYQNLWKELKDIPEAELLVVDNWFDGVTKTKNKNLYVCFVEADCLVNSGYFSSQMGLFKKNPMFKKIAMMSSSTGVNAWVNKFYGYKCDKAWGNPVEAGIEGTIEKIAVTNRLVMPIRDKKSTAVYPVQVGYVPGSIIRKSMLSAAMKTIKPPRGWENDLVFLSTQLSLAFWGQGDGNRVHINPNATYVTTEDYVNDLGKFDPQVDTAVWDMFQKEMI